MRTSIPYPVLLRLLPEGGAGSVAEGWCVSIPFPASPFLAALLTVPLRDFSTIVSPAKHLVPSPHIQDVVPELAADRSAQLLHSVAATYMQFTVHPAVSQLRFDVLHRWYWATWIIDDAFAPGKLSQSLMDNAIPRLCGWERDTLTAAHCETENDRELLAKINAAIKLMGIYHEQLPSCFPEDARAAMQQRMEDHFCTYRILNTKVISGADDFVRWRLDNGGMRWVVSAMYEVQREAAGACLLKAPDLESESFFHVEGLVTLITALFNDLVCIPLDKETNEENVVFVLERTRSLSTIEAFQVTVRWYNRLLRELAGLFRQGSLDPNLMAAMERIILGGAAWHWQQPRYQRGKQYLDDLLEEYIDY